MENFECIHFFALEKTELVSHRANFFDFYMRTTRTAHTPLARPSRGMPEDAKHSIYLNTLLASAFICVWLTDPKLRFSSGLV